MRQLKEVPLRQELLRHVPVADAEQLQFYLDEYRRYANADRSHQGLDGQTPEDVAKGATPAKVLDLDELSARRLVRRSYAHGLLNGYELVDDERRDAA